MRILLTSLLALAFIFTGCQTEKDKVKREGETARGKHRRRFPSVPRPASQSGGEARCGDAKIDDDGRFRVQTRAGNGRSRRFSILGAGKSLAGTGWNFIRAICEKGQ